MSVSQLPKCRYRAPETSPRVPNRRGPELSRSRNVGNSGKIVPHSGLLAVIITTGNRFINIFIVFLITLILFSLIYPSIFMLFTILWFNTKLPKHRFSRAIYYIIYGNSVKRFYIDQTILSMSIYGNLVKKVLY